MPLHQESPRRRSSGGFGIPSPSPQINFSLHAHPANLGKEGEKGYREHILERFERSHRGLDLPKSGSAKYRVARNMVPERSGSPPPKKYSQAAGGSPRATSACSDRWATALLWPPKVQLHAGREEMSRVRPPPPATLRWAGGCEDGGGSAFGGVRSDPTWKESAL